MEKKKTSPKRKPVLTSRDRVAKYRRELDEKVQAAGWLSWQDFTRAIKCDIIPTPFKPVAYQVAITVSDTTDAAPRASSRKRGRE